MKKIQIIDLLPFVERKNPFRKQLQGYYFEKEYVVATAPDILVNHDLNLLKNFFPDRIKIVQLDDTLTIDRQGDYTYYYNQGKLLMQRTKLKPFCYSYIIHKVD